MRCFSIESIREALALIEKLGVEIICGYISNGVYVYNQNEEKVISKVVSDENIFHKTHSPVYKETILKQISQQHYI